MIMIVLAKFQIQMSHKFPLSLDMDQVFQVNRFVFVGLIIHFWNWCSIFEDSESTPPNIEVGDIGMFMKGMKRRIAVVLDTHQDGKLLRVFLVKSRKQKMIRSRNLKFPDDYFSNRNWHIHDCGNLLTFGFLPLCLIVVCFLFSSDKMKKIRWICTWKGKIVKQYFNC